MVFSWVLGVTNCHVFTYFLASKHQDVWSTYIPINLEIYTGDKETKRLGAWARRLLFIL